jgi:Eco57I restriction-modification methylase
MVLDKPRARQLLAQGDLRGLFVNELGWDRHSAVLDIPLDAASFSVIALAQKRGMVAYECRTPRGQHMPTHAQRLKIERQVSKTAYEHFIVFTDEMNMTQVWEWVKREPGKPEAPREHAVHQGQPNEGILQKLEHITFTLEEEGSLSLIDVVGRARAGFDVDHVTKRFYDRFQIEHKIFLDFISGISAVSDREWYASVMLNRLMFVYFIQRKGFLDGDINYLRNRLNRLRVEHGQDKFYSFYRYFLLRLFHEALGAKKRPSDLEKLVGRIPYLNGGLFDIHDIEKPDRYGKGIQIPDQAFEHIFDYFDQYQWHLDERPLRADKEINPDVLGYIFEKYINQKQMGAYYTKEDITEYIGKNAVIPFLFERTRAECNVAFENFQGPTIWDMVKEDPDRYIYATIRHGISWDVYGNEGKGAPLNVARALPGDIAAGINLPTLHDQVRDGPVQTLELRTSWNKPAMREYALPTESWRDVVARRKHYEEIKTKLDKGEIRSINDLITFNLDILKFAQDVVVTCEGPDLLRAFWHAIENVTILDPTCGSGAFLFAALNILEPLYEACLERMQVFLDDLDRSGVKHRAEKFSDFRKILDHVSAHPNHHYFILKNIILKNLFGVDIMPEAVEICKLRLCLKLAAQVDPKTSQDNLGIEPLPDIDFNIRAGNTLVGYATYDEAKRAISGKLDFNNVVEKISVKAVDLQKEFDIFRACQINGDSLVPRDDKQDLRKHLKTLDDELNSYLASEYGIDPLKKIAYGKWLNSHQPFHWFVEFYGIVKAGGFDVIIGNPPYVEYKNIKNIYHLSEKQYASEKTDNLYAFCMERSCDLLQPFGRFGMIVPVSVLGIDAAKTLREVLMKRFKENWFSTYSIRPSKLFNGVDQRLCICLETFGGNGETCIWDTHYQHWNSDERATLFQHIEYAPSFLHGRLNRIPQIGNPIAASILKKLELKSKNPISHYYAHGKNGFLMHYHRSPRYWIRAMDFEQYFKSPTRTRSVHHFRDIYFTEEDQGKFIGAILNSTLFFFWFISIGNGRNITESDVGQFPVGRCNDHTLAVMPKLFSKLMRDYNKNSFLRERKDCEFQEFRPSLSKTILDKIDQILAIHYGFTEEELDFIINYDIKYRMGSGSDSDDE